MAGIVYLRTNKFEVKLEGITFKAKDFETMCSMDFLFPDGKTWARPPVVGIDVMRHPRDPNNILMLLCFGVGCVILKFISGDVLPESIYRFLTDERIRFVGFGIPEKKDLFPLEELGLTKHQVDIGYLAAKILDDPKYRKYELAELARRVLRVKTMIGLTQSSSFERHEQIKCAICQLFITSAIAMALLGKSEKKRPVDASKKSSSFLKNLNQLPLFTEGWFKLPKYKKVVRDKNKVEENKVRDKVPLPTATLVDDGFSGYEIFGDAEGDYCAFGDDPFHGKSVHIPYGDDDDDDDHDANGHPFHAKGSQGFFGDAFSCLKHKDGSPGDNHSKEAFGTERKPLKGILKSSSSARFEVSNHGSSRPDSGPDSSESSSQEVFIVKRTLKRANSKGYNVQFK
ncbi:unnamed protein product [Coffea canephora]|uniref:3'-5' exonuclease domain-containing protein n=1 Tax=Coffea canephora TaxID=49390 RepID=A0A068TTT3_COFCA|nr:unnamed protein product [Coffea canephora]